MQPPLWKDKKWRFCCPCFHFWLKDVSKAAITYLSCLSGYSICCFLEQNLRTLCAETVEWVSLCARRTTALIVKSNQRLRAAGWSGPAVCHWIFSPQRSVPPDTCYSNSTVCFHAGQPLLWMKEAWHLVRAVTLRLNPPSLYHVLHPKYCSEVDLQCSVLDPEIKEI